MFTPVLIEPYDGLVHPHLARDFSSLSLAWEPVLNR